MTALEAPMAQVLARNWWAMLIRGIVAVIFGILAFIWPGATILAIGILFGAYALVDGIFAIIATVRAAEAKQQWWPFLIEGIVGIRITLLALYLTIAAWAFITGILEIIAAIRLRKVIPNEFWLILGGIASIVFGILMVWFPLAGALALIWLIAAYAIVFGIIMIAFSFRLRSHLEHLEPPAATATT
jgi:uncharacterized membrane protein HdeD (DUF308 family)